MTAVLTSQQTLATSPVDYFVDAGDWTAWLKPVDKARVLRGGWQLLRRNLLGLKAVPCDVRMVHADWLRGRMKALGSAAAHALLHGLSELCQQHRAI